MYGSSYFLIWLILLIIPVFALWKRRWWSLALYILGCLIFLGAVLKGKDGWDDLADLAMLILVVIPIYIVASIVWVVGSIMERKRK